MPPVKTAPHLLQYGNELGFYKSTGVGMAPIDWSDIMAWCHLTGTELHPEECRILRKLSFAYVSQYNQSKEHDSPAPEL